MARMYGITEITFAVLLTSDPFAVFACWANTMNFEHHQAKGRIRLAHRIKIVSIFRLATERHANFQQVLIYSVWWWSGGAPLSHGNNLVQEKFFIFFQVFPIFSTFYLDEYIFRFAIINLLPTSYACTKLHTSNADYLTKLREKLP